MTDQVAAGALPFVVPDVTQADLSTFYETHFSAGAIDNFGTHFLPGPSLRSEQAAEAAGVEDEEYYYEEYEYADEEEDDGLGYYPDGVKRTLTDEQIAIFRHSEVEALWKAGKTAELSPRAQPPLSTPPPAPAATAEDLLDTTPATDDVSEGEIAEEPQFAVTTAAAAGAKKKKKKKRGKARSGRQAEPRVDLRKRTWDVVETGLESLDYDEMGGGAAAEARATQRRRVAYDGDD